MATLSCTLSAPLDKIFGVLSDYANYPLWAPDVVSATVLAREGDIVVAEFESPFLTEKKYVLEFLLVPPTAIAFKQVDQFGERGVRGRWDLKQARDGTGTVVTGSMSVRAEMRKLLINRRRARLIVRRRLDSLKEVFPADGDAVGRGSEGPADHPLLRAITAGEPTTVSWQGMKYVVTKSER